MFATPFSVLMPRANVVNANTTVAPGEPVKTKNLPHKTTQMPQSARWREGELLVRFGQNAPATDIDALLLTQGAQRGGRLRGQSGVERLSLSPGFDPAVVASVLRANRLVEFVEPNYLITADEITPNDPRFSEQWALRNTGTTGGQFGSDINVSQAWGVTTGSRRTVIAVIDSGIDFSHPDLRTNQWNNILEQANNNDDDKNGFADDLHGWDFVANSSEIKDEQGHGTAVAGVIAARGNNTLGISGVMWRTSLLSLRVLDNAGTGDIAGAVEAIDYAVQNGAQVINCSWGTEDASMALREAIERASRRGVVVVASAGNGGRDIETVPHYPASYDSDNLISVASTDNSDLLTSFSNWGATHVAIAVPGKDILTTKMGGDYQTISGSSVSAPFVTGVAGLIKTLRPWLGADRTREMILQGARRVPALTGKVSSGGVVNAAGALNALGTLPVTEGRNGGNGNNGGENGSTGNGRGSQAGTRPATGNRTNNRDGREFTVTPPAPTRGVPGPGLPNLDDLRRRPSTSSQAPAPIRSTRRSQRRSLHPPDGRRVGDRLSALDAGDFYPFQDNLQEQTPIELLAFNADSPALESLFGTRNILISDSPFSLTLHSRHTSKSILNSQSSSNFILELIPLAMLLPQTSNDKIAFASNRDGNAQIYRMNPDGSSQTRLTDNGTNDESPRWSPDNTRILFQSDRDDPFSGLAEIYVMNWDGTAQTRLTNSAADDSCAVWSPDGSKIAFQSSRNGLYYQVYVMNADGSNQINISNSSSNDGQPSWSPDGTKIAFTSERDHPGTPAIYVMNSNGSSQTRLTFSSSWIRDEQPAWSPDGTKIAFASTRDSVVESWQETDDDGGIVQRSAVRTNKEVYVMGANGSNQVRLTNMLGHDDSPSWSGDGTRIVFRSERERDCCDPMQQVWMMNADGSNQADLSNNWFGDYSPNWQRITANIPPSVSITSPTSGATFTAPANMTINANASDGDGVVSGVNFYQGATLIGTDTTSPYSVIWNNVASGSYALTARATDNAGAMTTSAAVNIVVNNNQLPTANTGGPYTGETTQSVQFNGSASSDSDGTITSYSWNFGDGTTAMGANPTHAFASPNTYAVTLTVTDNNGGQSSATTTITIRTTVADQYVRDFHQLTLARQPNASEQAYWNDILRKAYGNSQDSVLLASRELGRTMFESAEYAARQRSDHDFVYDLYRAYLHREPDQAGWDAWTNMVPTQGRENVRNGFAESAEFSTIIALLLPNGTAGSNSSSLLSARVDPGNRTGSGGEDLLSRNYNWGVPLLSLPGRAGMNLGLSLSYNSLLWTKSGPYIYFDEDNGSVSPGFRVDFPSIQGRHFNAATGQNAYLLMTSSGGRVELRQVGTTNVYESADSSYLQLTDNGNLLLKATDGTQLTYVKMNNEYRCTEIKDRNGNFMTINRNGFGQITTIIDTLSRTVTFNYDANQNLSSITQLWNGQAHQWATFGYNDKTIQTGFSPKIVGIRDNAAIPALIQVGFSDGTRYNFDYNAYGQVSIISHFAADGHQLGYTSYTLPASADDCPRVTERRDAAENWTGVNGVPAEVATQYGTEADGARKLTAPDGTVYKEYYGTGWQQGLTTQTEVWSGGVKRKWTQTDYTQDDTNLNYRKNPRVVETNVYDVEGNRKRTTIEYGPYVQWGLPYLVKEYAADGFTPIRYTYTDYNLNPEYVNRRIIGLVSAVHMSDGAWQSKTGYEYDAPGDQLQATSPNAIQHDASYGTSLSTGRGNLTKVSRYDVSGSNINDESKKLVTRTGYDTNGSVVFIRDHLGHQTNLSYTDSFSDTTKNSLNTFAYPTTVTDADGYSSTSQYSYDFGATTLTQSPTPTGQSQGAIQTFEYDGAGRTSRVNIVNNGAYRRWVYDPSGTISTYTLIQNGLPEAYSATVFDGLGAARASGGDHANSVGLYQAQVVRRDAMGRVVQSSNPTEINGSWQPAGDDAVGWIWTNQQYDWKGRPTVTTNPDGTTKSVTYGGCGCAGGEVVTLRDEMGRQQRVTSDILGRTRKTEVLEWYPSQTVYSTTINTFNARDQIINSRQYQETEASGIFQEAILTYDGYGRLATQKTPIQTSPTSYTYNPDNTPNVVTDARGATATFGYNNRHQVTGITYTAPSGVVATSPVSFGYDAAGNRTSMTDGLGSTSYNYDQLSRLTSETRQLTGVGSFTLSYIYNLANQLTSVTDHFGAAVGYTYDKTGKLTDVTGSGYANVTSYASNLRYRAWGAVKSMAYGNGLSLAASYTSRLQMESFEVNGRNPSYGPSTVMSSQYQYHADGSLRSAHDVLDERMDRAFSYDHAGRLQEAYTGSEARDFLNQTQSGMQTGPYRQSYQHDVWGQMTARTNRFWSRQSDFAANYLNGRNQNPSWQYDNDGRVLQDETLSYTYDAAGRNRQVSSLVSTRITTQEQDGDGQVVKRVEQQPNTFPPAATTTYYLVSSVLGGRVITELNESGQKTKGYVYAGGEVLARQEQNQVTWQHSNPLTGNRGESGAEGWYTVTVEADSMGVNVGVEDPFVDPFPVGFEPSPETPMIGGLGEGGGCSSSNPNCTRCFLDGFAIGCEQAASMMDVGAAIPAQLAAFQNRPGFIFQSVGLGLYRYYIPNTATLGDQIPNNNGEDGDVVRVNTDVPQGRWGTAFFGHGITQQNRIPTLEDLKSGKVKYTEEMIRCDNDLGELFGDDGAYMAANSFDLTQNDGNTGSPPQYRGDYSFNGRVFVGHLSNYAAHLYASTEGGSTATTNVYAPAGGVNPATGGRNTPLRIDEYRKPGSVKPGIENTADLLYYSQLGNLRNVTLLIVHVNRVRPVVSGGRILLGTTGGPGGDTPGGTPHAHFELLPGRVRVFRSQRTRIPFNRLCP
jgi:YD repeat-containing protein